MLKGKKIYVLGLERDQRTLYTILYHDYWWKYSMLLMLHWQQNWFHHPLKNARKLTAICVKIIASAQSLLHFYIAAASKCHCLINRLFFFYPLMEEQKPPDARGHSATRCFWLFHTGRRCSASTAGLQWHTPPSRPPEKGFQEQSWLRTTLPVTYTHRTSWFPHLGVVKLHWVVGRQWHTQAFLKELSQRILGVL